jgi:hypothetical protein
MAKRGPAVEGPFLTLGAIILAQRLGDYPASERYAAELIEEDKVAVRPVIAQDARFLLSLTWHSGAQLGWMELARELRNPSKYPALNTVIREIEESWGDP